MNKKLIIRVKTRGAIRSMQTFEDNWYEYGKNHEAKLAYDAPITRSIVSDLEYLGIIAS